MDNTRQEATRLIERIEYRYGGDKRLRRLMLPIVARILDSGPPSPQRRALLRLVVEAYARHMQVRKTIRTLRGKLRERLNEVYGEILGIEPPRVGY